MRKQLIVLLTAFALAIILCGSVTASESNNESEYSSEIMNTNIPFVENQGQTHEEVEYYADTFYGTVYITNDTITHAVKGANNTTMVLQEQFLDANGEAIVFHPSGLEQGSGKVDYYIGNDPSKWRTAINTWNTITLGEIYPGITVILKAHGANIEKIFQIAPGVNPDNINIQVLGADKIQLNAEGDLILSTVIGDIQLTKPIAYQDNQSVPVQYALQENTYNFQVGPYDTTKELIIDPTLLYSTYIGGTDNPFDDGGIGIAVDADGNICIVGTTSATDFPTTAGAFQASDPGGISSAFVSVLVPNGQGAADLIYSTYFGGSDVDWARSIAVDADDNIYVTGDTHSRDFPVTHGAFQTSNPCLDLDRTCGFVLKLGKIATKISVNNAKTNLGSSVDLTATLTANGQPLTGRTVIFKIDGVKIGESITNDLGMATMPYTPNRAGNFIITVEFAGDNLYAASNATGILTVDTSPTPTPNPANAKTIAMQKTGISLVGMVLAILMVLGGFISTRKK